MRPSGLPGQNPAQEEVPRARGRSGRAALLRDGIRTEGRCADRYVTSGGMGWRSGKMLAAGGVKAKGREIGSELAVRILMKIYKAKVLADPVYDPKNERLLG
ncbi:MAG: glycine cleavage T C-terminal barrel domain-containing protein [Cypionkella sp.]